MRNRLIFALLVLLTTSMLSAQENLTAEQFRQLRTLVQDAQAKFNQKQYAQSNDVYTKLLKQLPTLEKGAVDLNRARIHYHMAVNYMALEKAPEVYKNLEQAIGYDFLVPTDIEDDPTFATVKNRKEFRAVVEKARKRYGTRYDGVSDTPYELKDQNGKVLKKKDFAGKVVIIDVWGTWCRPCQMEIPHFVRLQKKYRDKGLRVIGLTWERKNPNDGLRQNLKRFAENFEINYPCVMPSGTTIDSIPGLDGFPTTFFIDRNGMVRDVAKGYHPYEDLERRALTLLNEKKSPKDTEKKDSAGTAEGKS